MNKTKAALAIMAVALAHTAALLAVSWKLPSESFGVAIGSLIGSVFSLILFGVIVTAKV